MPRAAEPLLINHPATVGIRTRGKRVVMLLSLVTHSLPVSDFFRKSRGY